MEENWKIIDFEQWCPTCVHKKDQASDPYSKCNDCLNEPARLNTQKPVNYLKEEK